LAGVRDGLAEMLAVMSADEEKRARTWCLARKKTFSADYEIGILDGENRAPEMGEGIFEACTVLALSAAPALMAWGRCRRRRADAGERCH